MMIICQPISDQTYTPFVPDADGHMFLINLGHTCKHHSFELVDALFCLMKSRRAQSPQVVGWLGLEPRTNALKGHCSTS